VGARNNLQRWLHLAGPLDYEGVHLTLKRWQRYGGLIYLHLLLDRLDRGDGHGTSPAFALHEQRGG
jgi:hypothetical protein